MDTAEMVQPTRYRKWAVSWLVFAGRVFGTPGKFYPGEPRFAKRYCYWYDLSLKYAQTFRIWIFIQKLMHLVFIRYIGKTGKAIFVKSQREAIFKRMKDREWYRDHLRSFKKYFVSG
jgi:hypothetical protein